MLRRLAAATTGAVLLSTVFVGTASAQDAQLDRSLDSLLLQAAEEARTPAIADGFYQKPYSSDVYQVATADGVQFSEVITFNRWVSLGRPVPQPLQVRYVTSSFTGDDIYAISPLPQPEDEIEFLTSIDLLDYSTWVAAGSPTPEADPYDQPPIVLFTSYAGSPEIYASALLRTDTDAELSVKLTYDEWVELGRPESQVLPISFVKLSWAPGIAAVLADDPETEEDESLVQLVTYDEWTEVGQPTPVVAARFEGDQFFRATAGTSVITYDGPTASGPITYDQWLAAGSPQPTDGPQ